MADNSVFKELNLEHNPHRSPFNLSENVYFTAKCSELLPIYHRTVQPEDSFDIDVSWFTRTMPFNSASSVQIREYVDLFFIPYSYLWKNAKQTHTNNTKNPVSAESYFGNRPVGLSTPRFRIDNYYSSTYTEDPDVPKPIAVKLGEKKNLFGFNRFALSAKLMNMLGYGYASIDDIRWFQNGGGSDNVYLNGFFNRLSPKLLSLYPLLAYQACYYSFYRNKQWEENQPYNYNVDYLGVNATVDFDTTINADYWDNPTIFDMHYCNYPKDLFFGILPDAQYGDTAVAEIDIDNSFDWKTAPTITHQQFALNNLPVGAEYQSSLGGDANDGKFVQGSAGNVVGSYGYTSIYWDDPVPVSGNELIANASRLEEQVNDGVKNNVNRGVTSLNTSLQTQLRNLFLNLKGSLNMLELRKASFEQKYREIYGSGDLDYRTLVRKLYGSNVSEYVEGLPRYLGGSTSNIDINVVTNTNLNESDATLKATGTGRGNTNKIHFESNGEFGIIMAIYHCQPTVQYALNNFHFDVTKVESDDFANPVFDQLGFQELPLHSFTVDRDIDISGASGTIGYTTRYYDYKTGLDRTLGNWRENLDATGRIAPVTESILPLVYANGYDDEDGYRLDITSNFFKINPRILDNVFAVKCGDFVDTDQFEVQASINIGSVRPLDYRGLPYA